MRKLLRKIGKGFGSALEWTNGHKTTIGSTLTSLVFIADGVWDLNSSIMTGLLGLAGTIFGGGILHKLDKKTNVINRTITNVKNVIKKKKR